MSGATPANNSGAQQPAAASGQVERIYSFTVRTVSGNVVYSYTGCDLSIERLLQDFDEGLIPNVPRAACTEDGVYTEHYRLFWGTVELLDGQRFGDYENFPESAVLTVVVTQEETSP